MSRLPFFFIITGMIGFVLFHAASLLSLFGWLGEGVRGPSGWFHIHLFVLGWATMLAMGAVYQLINVILQTELYSERLGYVHYVCFTIGLAGLLYGFLQGEVYFIAASATIAMIGILLFAWNMTVTLIRASLWNAITISAACAVLYLVLTAASGLMMGINFATGQWIAYHEQIFHAHIWLGTVGWFGLLITGFSYKMLPMFYLAHHYPVRLQIVSLLLWNAAVLFGAVSFITGGAIGMQWFTLLLLTLAVTVYNLHLLQIIKHRNKRNPGCGIKWSVYANQTFALFAIIALLYTLAAQKQLFHAEFVLVAGWIYLGGWVSFTILGYSSKIVPFLWWTHKYGKLVGKPGTPMMSALLNEQQVNRGLAAIAITTLLLLAALLLQAPTVITVAGAAYSLCSLVYISRIGLVFRQ
ncbi:cbb3-type cytochrome c oxidase subunit I [Paenibacillus oenotherae]|uniref:Cbb3-type cytochrome c oxidase subunit I n=1 Tax=Paenibacillus oenotherae TaxID=1435645 RepID=A0ABS7D621_9BACL|nr:cbb3-type cytochrome c oxidase subunit I [Paenibacillus oenotherae]MBW7475228.1 cbb3-type cytochrome c oxidase subunit I [Paenibacillus oenotherae]